ncbi:thioredoxin-disulfide reductase [Clostridium sp. AF32-7AC]|uniref:thioredoxin-disulfide reductase n=2 Tax=Clostridiaceae TaxID=31979 RepID=UPI000E49F0EE|nr:MULTISPECIES: thioredoxin-disulfide reductase [Clostridium]RHO92271.1 thioredoxin-disulfide reductase [Clostridium sp. AF37-7]RHQ92187.1 thioredoxin-disulfide reductase [Clostridium sp. AF21-20LB]MBD9274699.1 thioredoxin-disulfide reductase [Clostridium sp.]MCC2171005.1 thioredoxin-disulfide reductase [Clostridium fessum]RHP41284.1 thioredoxin-disulfide reductase [Clostridium sp. AF32-7AC]
MYTMYDIIIIGSGPAGLSAAIYAQRACLDTIVIEKNGISGGQVLNTWEVDNYPGFPGVTGFELSRQFREHANKLGARVVQDEVVQVELSGNVKKVVCEEETYEARCVILASGAHHRTLEVPGEEELRGAGVSYCATCDGAFFRGRTVAVVGGGDAALEDAIFLARMCEKVYIVHRRDKLRGAKRLQERLQALENIEFVWNSETAAIEGNGQVEALRLRQTKTGEEKRLDVDGVFIAVGIAPESELYAGQLELDEQGYIRADESGQTSVPGVFAAGDVRTKALRQILTAASDGANCVASAERYLQA